MDNRLFKILSIDGGGVRGIIPAIVISEIERRLGKPICQCFDLICGTSTGGILALALSVARPNERHPYSAKDVARFYEEECPKIFSNGKGIFTRVFRPKYDPAQFDESLKNLFQKAKLSEALTDILVTSYCIERRKIMLFKSWESKIGKTDDFLIGDVARATSAAPTYFLPHKVSQSDGKAHMTLVDGGLFANNPTLLGVGESIKRNRASDGLLVVSLGTGDIATKISHQDVRDWGGGEIFWARKAFDISVDGTSDMVHQQASLIIDAVSRGRGKYYRFQRELNEKLFELDDASPNTINALKIFSEELLESHEKQIVDICSILKASD